jgi:hypothetical protein
MLHTRIFFKTAGYNACCQGEHRLFRAAIISLNNTIYNGRINSPFVTLLDNPSPNILSNEL